MAKLLQYRRLLMLVVVLAAAFAGLGYRLVDLQVFRHEDLSARAQSNVQCRLQLEPKRGDILDAKGNVLATSIFVKTICCNPSIIGEHDREIAQVMAPILKLSEADLLQRFNLKTHINSAGTTVTNLSVVVKKKVSVEAWEQVRDTLQKMTFTGETKNLSATQKSYFRALRSEALFADPVDDQLRVYPNQSLAAHVIGYTGQDGVVEADGRRVDETGGREGIEARFDKELKGVSGWRVTEMDRRRRELVAAREQDVEARDGLNVVLTIDSVVQHIVETALAEGMERNSPQSITGIALRPRTGEILAMATLPTYDPNNLTRSTADERRNRVITDIAEPGSTFKIVVVSGALNERVVSLNDTFDCEHGHFFFAGKNLHDHEPEGVLTVERIITKSSNIGAAKIGIKMGEDLLSEYIHDFGFGERTGIPLPGEVPGRVYPVKKWSKVSIAQIPMGQGVAVTRLQMAMAMAAIANNGSLMRPMLVDRLEDNQHHTVAQYSPQRVRQVISPEAARQVVQALKTVATTNGTAAGAALEHYTVAGKTGTAQKAEHGIYAPGKYVSSFIGFFPADDPQLLIAVVLEEPKGGHYGGKVAAPIFKDIATRAANYLNIKPEINLAPGDLAADSAKLSRDGSTYNN